MRYVWVGIAYVVFGTILYGADANSATATKPVQPTPSATAQPALRSEPNSGGTTTVEEAIAQQKSIQKFSALAIDRTELLQLAWAGSKTITASRNDKPIELYFCLADGVYRYNPAANSLDGLGTVDVRNMLTIAAQNEAALQEASCVIVLAGSVGAAPTGTRTRARDKMMLDAGKISQTISLEATSIGLATMSIGSFDISKVKRLTKISAQQEPLYIIAVGHSADAPRAQTTKNSQPRALLIIDGSDRSAELFNVMDALTAANIRLTIAQRSKSPIRIDKYQRAIEPDMWLQDVIVTEYDAVVVVSNSGNLPFMRDQMIHNIIREAVREGKIVGTLGGAAQVLANADVINGVRVTGDRRLLVRAGGIYTEQLVESDKGIVTTMNNQQLSLFARTIIDMMENATPQPSPAISPSSTKRRQNAY